MREPAQEADLALELVTVEVTAGVIVGVTAEVTAGVTAEVTVEVIAEAMGEATEEVIAEAMGEATEEVIVGTMGEATGEAMEEATEEVTTEVIAEAMEEATVEVMGEATAEATGEAMEEATTEAVATLGFKVGTSRVIQAASTLERNEFLSIPASNTESSGKKTRGTSSGLRAWPDGAGCAPCNVRSHMTPGGSQVWVDVRLQGLPTPSSPLRTPRVALKAGNLAGAAVWPFQPRGLDLRPKTVGPGAFGRKLSEVLCDTRTVQAGSWGTLALQWVGWGAALTHQGSRVSLSEQRRAGGWPAPSRCPHRRAVEVDGGLA
ncbi:unnamed protein product [Rangifer tarandus platyrhynchus]|uniref:Uncharacterized protein n=1 Tax=Rangifer tarandus platyrhynchus TaxID=3082113 RepID=A0ABN8XW52_RANTA|nr:unnamed protein product [Rangifer tarandus platyrhynchus]